MSRWAPRCCKRACVKVSTLPHSRRRVLLHAAGRPLEQKAHAHYSSSCRSHEPAWLRALKTPGSRKVVMLDAEVEQLTNCLSRSTELSGGLQPTDCKSVLSFRMRVRRSIFLAQQRICLGISDHELLLRIPRQTSAQLHRVVRQDARRG